MRPRVRKSHLDSLVKTQLLTELAVLFMKKVTFNLTCTQLFSIHDEPKKERSAVRKFHTSPERFVVSSYQNPWNMIQ